MKHQPLISSHLYCMPWHVLPSAHAELCGIYRQYLEGHLPAAPEVVRTVGEPEMLAGGRRVGEGVAYSYDTELGVAVIWADGIVTKQDPQMMSGPRMLSLIRLEEALNEVGALDVANVILYLDTPGGSSVGLPEAADALMRLGEEKNLVGYSDTLCCSAGAWLMAATNRNYYARSAINGSIGTYIAALDSSRAFEMEGLELKLYRHGELKAAGMPGKKWTKKEEEYFAGLVKSHGEEFRAWMRERRPGLEVEDMQGQWFTAKDGPAALVDGYFNSLSELIAALADE